MTVIVLTACPPGLRGDLTRWFLEIAPGVFVGRPSARVREHIWIRVADKIGLDGKALMTWSVRNEQRLDFRRLHHDWIPEDFEGVKLIRRPAQ